MEPREMKDLVARFVETFWNQGDFQGTRNLITDDLLVAAPVNELGRAEGTGVSISYGLSRLAFDGRADGCRRRHGGRALDGTWDSSRRFLRAPSDRSKSGNHRCGLLSHPGRQDCRIPRLPGPVHLDATDRCYSGYIWRLSVQ